VTLYSLFLLAFGLAAAPALRPLDVAITIDDVPWTGRREGGDTVSRLTREMIATLRRHEAPVAVFVSCRKDAASRAAIKQWMDAGATIGNHTTGHHDLHTAALATWESAVRDCDDFLKHEMRADVRWFRYPMLHQGRTPEQRERATRVLRELKLRNAPVTIDNNDFLLVASYGKSPRRIGRLMLEHDSLAMEHFRALAPDVPHVLLLHANRMTAENLDALLTMLQRMGARFISLDSAMSHPVYSKPDLYTGSKGLSWLYRIRPDGATLARWDDEQAEWLRRQLRN
jgi:peptidoglycan/xylan/chitin deacetylase (PgdA/CDA1 family)